VLYIHQNKLKKLPESLGNLRHLQTLNLSNNNLKELPASLGCLGRLRSLNVTANLKLSRLPKTLAKAQGLEKLELDANCFSYPSKDVCACGLEDIMKFLSKGINIYLRL